MSSSHNLVGGNLSDIFATGLLADNGGPTQTIALKIGGPAINAGDDSLAVDAGGNPLTTDQRGVGFNRFVGTVDLGAFEFESSDNAAPTSTIRFPAAGGSYTAASWNAGAPIAGTAFDNGPTTINDFAIPTAPYSGPEGITAGPDGNLWFVEDNADKIAMINPATHVIQEFAIPTANSSPTGITAGADGNLWFTEYEYDAGNKIGQFNPTTHVFQEFTIPTAQSGPQSITAGPDGNLWFVEGAANKIGTIDPTTHVFQEFTIPTVNSGPDEITVGPDGNLWFTEYTGHKIGQINPTTHAFQEFDFLEGGSTGGITTGSDGNLWFAQGTRNIDQFNPTTQAFQEFTLPTPVSSPNGITAGADGNLWFAEFNTNKSRADQPDHPCNSGVHDSDRRQSAVPHRRRPGRQPVVHRSWRQQDRPSPPRFRPAKRRSQRPPSRHRQVLERRVVQQQYRVLRNRDRHRLMVRRLPGQQLPH